MKVEVTVKKSIPATATKVWALLSEFSDMSWAGFTDVIVEGEGVGSVRKVLVAPDSTRAVERLESLDTDKKQFSYAVLEGLPIPARDLIGTVTVVEESDERCTVIWQASAVPISIDPEELKKILLSVYQHVLDSLIKHFQVG